MLTKIFSCYTIGVPAVNITRTAILTYHSKLSVVRETPTGCHCTVSIMLCKMSRLKSATVAACHNINHSRR